MLRLSSNLESFVTLVEAPPSCLRSCDWTLRSAGGSFKTSSRRLMSGVSSAHMKAPAPKNNKRSIKCWYKKDIALAISWFSSIRSWLQVYFIFKCSINMLLSSREVNPRLHFLHVSWRVQIFQQWGTVGITLTSNTWKSTKFKRLTLPDFRYSSYMSSLILEGNLIIVYPSLHRRDQTLHRSIWNSSVQCARQVLDCCERSREAHRWTRTYLVYVWNHLDYIV